MGKVPAKLVPCPRIKFNANGCWVLGASNPASVRFADSYRIHQ